MSDRFVWRRVGASALLLAAVAACSGSDDSDVVGPTAAGADDLAELVELLPEDAPQIVRIDVAAIREQLGLPDDQEMGDLSDESTAPLAYALGRAVPFLGDPRETPIREVFDTGAMTGAASVPLLGRGYPVVVVRTSQPFDDLAAALEDRGYERDGDLVVSTSEGPSIRLGGVTAVTTAADADDVIVLAGSTDVATAVGAGEGEGPALAEALRSVDGPVRAAIASTPDSNSCVETAAVGAQTDPPEGEIALTVAEGTDADGVDLFPADNRIARDIDPDPPQVDGQTVTAHYRYNGVGSPIELLFSEVPAGDLFRCP